MVRGLERFRTHFEHYNDRYVLIGGTACTLAMQDFGLEFRATKDIDIVLFIETLLIFLLCAALTLGGGLFL